MKVDENIKIKDLMKTASGNDIISRMFYALGLDERIVYLPFISSIKLKDLPRLSMGKIDEDMLKALLELLNNVNYDIKKDECEIQEEWWKEAVFYEIYPRSFKDSNNDGIGDIEGIIQKLDYLKDLGVDALWVCPFYDSPGADNGYDVRDYYKVQKEFGEPADVKRLFKEVHKRGMRIIVDLVLNHTSDEHEWFKKSLKGIKPYDDFYIWRDKPNNWESMFKTDTWKYFKERKQYALHLFCDKQMDLNWDNEELRQEMYKIAGYWLKEGADGFRLDVACLISKENELSDGNEKIGELIGFTGIEKYFHGPHLDEYLKEFNQAVLRPHNAYAVGECPGHGIYMSRYLTGDDNGELNQSFNFDHLENPGKIRYMIYDVDLRKTVKELTRWQEEMSNHCWPTLFFNNHDTPRMNSKVDHTGKYNSEISKLLITVLMTLKGTPYLYQGEEIGMTNYPFKKLDEYKDVETLSVYESFRKKYKANKNQAMKHLLYGSRDHARTPMQWNDEEYAGFSSHKPWLNVNPNYKEINVERQTKQPDSVLNYYKKAIKLRHDNKCLIYGAFKKHNTDNDIFMFERNYKDERFTVLINLTDKIKKNHHHIDGEIVLKSYEAESEYLRPYEARVYRISRNA